MERVRSALLAAALVLAVVGAAAEVLLVPAYTRTLVVSVDAPARAGLSPAQTVSIAEEVRAHVAGARGAHLPDRLPDGRPAFGEKAVSHLDDVRDVIAVSRIATVASALLAVGLIAFAAARREHRALVAGLRWGGGVLMGSVVIVGAFALLDFDRFFAGFHALFFAPGTWQFSADALLIRLFPEPFWVVTALAWGALIVFGGVLSIIAGRVVENRRLRVDA